MGFIINKLNDRSCIHFNCYCVVIVTKNMFMPQNVYCDVAHIHVCTYIHKIRHLNKHFRRTKGKFL